MENEILDLVDRDDNIIGQALRRDVHGDPALIHRAVHVLIFNSKGELFMQKRSRYKDIQPGKWDTSVGGHVDSGESYEQAAVREMQEELGIGAQKLDYLYDYNLSNAVESENIRSYKIVYDGPVDINRDELEEGRFFSLTEIEQLLKTGFFTPNFEQEFRYLLESEQGKL